MRHQNSKTLFKYWNELRGNRNAPDRCEIEPSDIRAILGDTFILEINQAYKNLSFRLAGTRLCNAHGRELKGIGFLSIWDEKDNLNVYKSIRHVFENARPCVLSYTAHSEQGKALDFEMLLLPLLNGANQASRILGTTSPLEKPAWLGADPIDNCTFKYGRFIDLSLPPLETEITPPLDPAQSIAEDGLRKVKHLTIIDGGIG